MEIPADRDRLAQAVEEISSPNDAAKATTSLRTLARSLPQWHDASGSR
jgi:hypothetical protein